MEISVDVAGKGVKPVVSELLRVSAAIASNEALPLVRDRATASLRGAPDDPGPPPNRKGWATLTLTLRARTSAEAAALLVGAATRILEGVRTCSSGQVSYHMGEAT